MSLARHKTGDQLTTTTPVESSSPRTYASESWSPLEESEQSKEEEDGDEKESVVAVVVPPRQAQSNPEENQQQQQQQQQPLANDSGGCFPSRRRRQQQRPAKSKPVQQQQHPKDEEQQPHHVDKGLDKDLSLLAVNRITATARAVKILRGTVLLILILAATLVSIGVYRYTKHEEQVRFETEYQFNSRKLLEAFLDAIERRLGAIDAMATSCTSHALATNQTFPRFTLPDFGTYIWNIYIYIYIYCLRLLLLMFLLLFALGLLVSCIKKK